MRNCPQYAILQFLIAFLAQGSGCDCVFAQDISVPFSRTVTRIEAGVPVSDESRLRWNRTVLLAKPRISSGDTESLAGFLRQSVSKYVLTLLATVEAVPSKQGSAESSTGPIASSDSQDTTAPASQRFRLSEVGVGHSVQVGNRWIVIRPDDYEAHGVKLSFFERQILAENQRQFSEIRTIARMSTLLMFDVPAVLLYDGKHQDFDMRHLVWIDSKTGRLFTLIWLLQPQSPVEGDHPGPAQVVATEPLCWWDGSQIEDRAIHVDQGEFTLGIPGKRAFALEKMPSGRAIAWNTPALQLAGLPSYDQGSLRALLTAFNQANQDSLKTDSKR